MPTSVPRCVHDGGTKTIDGSTGINLTRLLQYIHVLLLFTVGKMIFISEENKEIFSVMLLKT